MKIMNWTLSLLLFILPFILIEFSTQWWIKNYADPLQRARRILTLDEELGWKARPNLDLLFEGRKLFTDFRGLRVLSPSQVDLQSKKILVLGPSSAFGWGVSYEEAWPALIADNSVLNASQVGYSIVQGQKIYERLRENGLSGIKTVILAYGVNDIDRFRFFDQENLSDVEYFKQLGKDKLLGAMYTSGILSLLARGYQEAGVYFRCGFQHSPVLRVGVDEFSQHLRDFIVELRKQDMGVILVNSANSIQVVPNDLKADESDRFYEESARAAQGNQCLLSRKLFFQAKQYESWRVIRDINKINLAIQKTGQEMDVPVVDIATDLDGMKNKPLFVDPIHFSVEGHRIVAEKVKTALMELK